jgi:hypothetical protein
LRAVGASRAGTDVPRVRSIERPVPIPSLRFPTLSNDDFRRAVEQIKLRAPIEEVVREYVPEGAI